jgi:hypothetical protein
MLHGREFGAGLCKQRPHHVDLPLIELAAPQQGFKPLDILADDITAMVIHDDTRPIMSPIGCIT